MTFLHAIQEYTTVSKDDRWKKNNFLCGKKKTCTNTFRLNATIKLPQPPKTTTTIHALVQRAWTWFKKMTSFHLETRLLHETVKVALLLVQRRGRVKLDHLALVQDNDAVTVHNGIQAVRHGNDGAVGK